MWKTGLRLTIYIYLFQKVKEIFKRLKGIF